MKDDHTTKLLVVDDDAGILETLTDIFELQGYMVSTASTGGGALKRIKDSGIDVALVDLKLPDADGIDVIQSIKQYSPKIPCFVITGNASIQSAISALRKGAEDYFVKPLVIDKVLHSLKAALKRKKIEQDLHESEIQLDRNFEFQKAINNVLNIALSDESIEKVFEHALCNMLSMPWTSYEKRGAIFLVKNDRKSLEMITSKGFSEEEKAHCEEVPWSKCYCGKAAEEKKILFSAHGEKCFACSDRSQAHGHYCIPIILGNQTAGVINLNTRKSHTRNSQDEDFLISIANTLAGILKRKKIEQKNLDLERRAEQSQRLESMGTLAGGIAHDFNNILTAINGFAEIVLETLNKGQEEYGNVQQILHAGNRAKTLVQQILTFSRNSEPIVQPIVLAPIIEECIKLLRSSIPANIEIRQSITPQSNTIAGNPTLIHQIIMNIGTNAYHAMMDDDKGLLSITLRSISSENLDTVNKLNLKPGKYVMIEIQDSGHGIAKDILHKIYDPYFTTKEKGKGTGLGLSMVHGIVTSHGGEITVKSRPGEGTIFRIYFPKISENCHDETTESENVPRGKGEKILFIDDESLICELAQVQLSRLGYEVETFEDSLKALSAFQNKPESYDMVITDMNMPGITGEKLIPKLIDIRKDLPVILCSGFSDKVDEEQAQALNVKCFAWKPIPKAEFARLIRKAFDE